MRKIDTNITINATPEKVWQVLTNFKAYPQWNPFIRNIRGEAKLGAKLNVTIQGPGTKAMNFKPTIIRFQPKQGFRWLGRFIMPGLFDGEHCFIIEPINDTQVKFIHKEKFSGLLVGLTWRAMEKKTTEGFARMNQALKEQCEQ